MKINALIKKLEKLLDKHGNVDVMFQDGDGDSVWCLESVQFRVAEEDEFPKEWNMKPGYKFVLLDN